jgi:O-antigen/teichoic acid export membrane protein
LSVRKNSIANYIGQSYVILIGIVITPLYLQYLSSESYGLVGFFALMQAWMLLLDLGMSPTLGRQVALARGQENGFIFFKRLFKSFEMIFFGLSIVIVAGIFLASNWIATVWISSETLEIETIAYCIGLMGVIMGFRWISGLYRSGINGLEKQVWLNVANSVLISLKFVGALVLLAFVTQDIHHFFEYQLFIGLVELLIFIQYFYRKIPITKDSPGLLFFDWVSVKHIAPYALSVAYTAGIWVVITQTDKLILSGILSLSEFGYFSLLALVSGGVTMLSGPISQAIMPRMTILLAQGKNEEMLRIYRQGSQIVTFITFAVALTIGLYAEQLLYAWTGDRIASSWGADILIWFALGNAMLAVGAFQYYLQSVYGQLRLHVIGATISVLIQVPIIYFASVNYGALGAGISWFIFRTLWFIWWTPIVHRRFLPGFHLKWLFKDILPIIGLLSIVSLALLNLFDLNLDQNRLLIFAKIAALGFFLLLLSIASVHSVRRNFIQIIKLKFRAVYEKS